MMIKVPKYKSEQKPKPQVTVSDIRSPHTHSASSEVSHSSDCDTDSTEPTFGRSSLDSAVEKESPHEPQSVVTAAPCLEVAKKLNLKRKRVNQSVHNLLDAMLRAVCAVSPFRELLESRRSLLAAGEENIIAKASIKELAELKLLEKVNSEWQNTPPMEFLVRVFANLDCLGDLLPIVGSIFSICVSKASFCDKCESYVRSTINLGALRVKNSFRFETSVDDSERVYFNRKKGRVAKGFSAQEIKRFKDVIGKGNKRKPLQQFLADGSFSNPVELRKCTDCNQQARVSEVSELQSLGPGLIVILSKGELKSTGVPRRLNLEQSPAARCVFQLRAAVLQETDYCQGGPGLWVCVEILMPLHDKFEHSPLLLFYEKDESAKKRLIKCGKTLLCYDKILICREVFREMLDLQPWIPLFQQVKKVVQTALDSATAKVATWSRQMEIDKAEKLAHMRRTACLETALRGLFAIKAFTAFFTLEQAQASQVVKYIKMIYELQEQQSPLGEGLEEVMKLLHVEDCSVHNYIIKILSECDSSAMLESACDLSQIEYYAKNELIKKREGKCEVLHNVFSVLVRSNSIYSASATWDYSRVLDISLKTQTSTVYYSSQFTEIPSIIDLKTCINKQLLFPSYFYQPSSKLKYLGSALIIRLFEESTETPHEKLVEIPRTLDMKSLGIIDKPVYRLRALVNYPKDPQKDQFAMQTIDDSRETDQMLKRGCRAYLLFYEQEEQKPQVAARVSVASQPPPPPTNTANSEETKSEKRLSHHVQIVTGKKAKVETFSYGLQNLGNTCFMNAALNGLFSLHSFCTHFVDSSSRHPLLSAFTEFCSKYTKQEIPSGVLHRFKSAIPEFSDGRQHCANSYTFNLLMLFDKLIPSSTQKSFAGHNFADKLRQYRTGKCGKLHDVFSALAENLFICKECSNTSSWRNFSYFRTVDVPIPYSAETVNEETVFSEGNFYPGSIAAKYTGTPESESQYKARFSAVADRFLSRRVSRQNGRIDLHLCFKFMLRASLMTRENKMPCSRCGADTQHYKQSFLRQLSTALVIHFQRFNEITRQKLNTPVAFPQELDMSKYCANDPRQYVLRGVVYHMGDLDYGHYTACINVNERWYSVNDSYVEERSTPPIENAYMLFYEEKTSTRS